MRTWAKPIKMCGVICLNIAFLLAMPRNVGDLGFPARDRTHTPCSGRMESQLLDHHCVCVYVCVCVCVLVAQLCLTLCDPMDCSQPGSSVHGIFQGRILGWEAIPFYRGSSQPRDRTAF